ncbi:hypothetical protein Npun_AR283 [Leptolyngbya sp. NIES-3755]|nr:hypothetical protein Npun_AR283 [Leptolyngbya sp. NIES-3755]
MEESVIYQAIQKEAQEKTKREITINLLREGFPIDSIACGTGLSIEEVQQLQQQLNDSAQQA